MWLLIGVCAITAATVSIVAATADPSDRTFTTFMAAVAIPQQFVLPVLGILLITSEWTKRTALVSFTLEPARVRLVGAKIAAALLFGLGAVVVALIVATAATAVVGNDAAWETVTADAIGRFALLQATSILEGLAFGLVFLNSAGAIATYLIVPTAFGILSSFWQALDEVAPWIALNRATGPLLEAEALSGEEWAQLGVTSVIWIALPVAVGLFQVLRREVK
jgi:ABC-type transport system involved in multi-copper enzyme maturation permease subunit